MYDGYLVVLAWPETKCKQAGAWYDGLMRFLGVNKGGYYKVGHSAFLLIDSRSKECEYYDFGRYHSPFKHGRIRTVRTDHDLKVNTQVLYGPNREILNLDMIIRELYTNRSTHGTGRIYAAISKISMTKAKLKINEFQSKGFIPYGPFIYNGTNCSRFVNKVLLASSNSIFTKLKCFFPLTLSPTPMWAVVAAEGKRISYGLVDDAC